MSLTAVERAEDNADQLPDYVNIHSELLDIKFYSKKKKILFITHYFFLQTASQANKIICEKITAIAFLNCCKVLFRSDNP